MMVSLQQELDVAKEGLAREKDRATLRAEEDEEELQILRDRCEQLESERGKGGEVRDQQMICRFSVDHALCSRIRKSWNNFDLTWRVLWLSSRIYPDATMSS